MATTTTAAKTGSQAESKSTSSWHGFERASLPEVPAWVETLGRAGYIAKGAVYFMIGLLAFKLAIGAGGEIAGSREAIKEIGQQPYGQILLGLTAIGLLAYTAWRFVQAAKDTEGNGTDASGIVKRIGYVISGIAYLALGIFAAYQALGMGGGSGGSGSSQASWLLDSSWGRGLLGIAGAVTVGVGCSFLYKAYQAKFMTKYRLRDMSEKVRQAALHIGRAGVSTRGVAFIIVGAFIVMSAVRGTGDGEIAGMSDALAFIASQSYGMVLIGVTGFGLMCYAVHSMLKGWYRRFNVG